MTAAPVLRRAAERPWVPWRNGGGLTSLVAVDDAAPGDGWDWRISVAHVDTTGPFSHFDGVDRVLTVLSGLLELTTGDGNITLLASGQALRFPGEAPIVGRPLGSGVVDLNVMVRRERCAAAVDRIGPMAGEALPLIAGTTILFFAEEGRVETNGIRIDLEPHDALIVRNAAGSVIDHVAGKVIHLIGLSPRL